MPSKIKKMQFEVDWVKIWLEENEYCLEKWFTEGRFEHVKVKINCNNQLTIETSGRVVKNPTYLGGITPENFDMFYQEIRKIGIIVSREALLNARITKLDVKRDIHLGINTKLPDYISSLRERAIPNNSRFHTILFNKNGRGVNSLLIKSTTKTVVDFKQHENKSYTLIDAKTKNPLNPPEALMAQSGIKYEKQESVAFNSVKNGASTCFIMAYPKMKDIIDISSEGYRMP